MNGVVNTTMLPPAQPSYILRGHQTQVNAVAFYADNSRLLSGDGDGLVIAWDVVTKRPVVAWHAHGKAILGLSSWPSSTSKSHSHGGKYTRAPTNIVEREGGEPKTKCSTIITHGRDGRIRVWQLKPEDEDDTTQSRYIAPQQIESITTRPIMLMELETGTVSFCAFAMCKAPSDMTMARSFQSAGGEGGVDGSDIPTVKEEDTLFADHEPLLVIAPNAQATENFDIFYMPTGARKGSIRALPGSSADVGEGVTPSGPGMAMTVLIATIPIPINSHNNTALFVSSSLSYDLMVAAGYESGEVLIYLHNVAADIWQAVYRSRPHSQPVLSLCLHPSQRFCISSSADAVLAKHPFVELADVISPHTSDEAISNDMSDMNDTEVSYDSNENNSVAADTHDSRTTRVREDKPLAVVNTRHAGQQGLAMRSDGRLFVAAGWDSRARVYSAKTMKQLAVLKQHRLGCFATAFAQIVADDAKGTGAVNDGEKERGKQEGEEQEHNEPVRNASESDSAAKPLPLPSSTADEDTRDISKSAGYEDDGGQKVNTVDVGPYDKTSSGQESPAECDENKNRKSRTLLKYEDRVRHTHWLAVGSKDGTVSLWDVF